MILVINHCQITNELKKRVFPDSLNESSSFVSVRNFARIYWDRLMIGDNPPGKWQQPAVLVDLPLSERGSKSMHAIQVPAGGSSPGAASYIPCVTFAPDQNESVVTKQRIGTLVAERTAQHRLFYGIEVMASDPSGRPTCLDFNHFLPLLPTFVSFVWLSQRYWDVEPVGQVESLQMAQHLATRIPVLPHVSAYRMSRQRLDQFLALNFSSLLAVRGDRVHEDQDFSISYPMVEQSIRQRGGKLIINYLSLNIL